MEYSLSKLLNKLVLVEVENQRLTDKNEVLGLLIAIKNDVEKRLKKSYKNVTGKQLNLPNIDIVIDNTIKKGKIAGFDHPKNGEKGLIGVKEKALKNKEYLKWVITHELIHASVGEDLPTHKEHSGLFKKIADEMGLPEEYQD